MATVAATTITTTTAVRERKKTIFYNDISVAHNKLSLSSKEKSLLNTTIPSGHKYVYIYIYTHVYSYIK